MTYNEFKNHVGKAGLNLYQFAELIKMHRSSITNCATKEEIPTHLAVIAALLGEMRENGLDFFRILSVVDIKPKRPRGGKHTGSFAGKP
jgi:hypothetical protein